MRFVFVLTIAALAASTSVGAVQDADAGRQKAGQCQTCHGLDGIARIPVAPHLAGESTAYLMAQLDAFRAGTRENEMMSVVAKSLSDEDIADLAAWYGSLSIEADLPEDTAGLQAVELCTACHGEDGIATIDEAPHLAGENEIYIVTQLKAFRSGQRVHDIMTPIAREMSDEEMRDAAKWYAGIDFTSALPE